MEKCSLPWTTGGGRRGRLEELDGNIQRIQPLLRYQALSVDAVMIHMLTHTPSLAADPEAGLIYPSAVEVMIFLQH